MLDVFQRNKKQSLFVAKYMKYNVILEFYSSQEKTQSVMNFWDSYYTEVPSLRNKNVLAVQRALHIN